MDEFLRFERVEFERIVGERNFKQREPYDTKGCPLGNLPISLESPKQNPPVAEGFVLVDFEWIVINIVSLFHTFLTLFIFLLLS